MASYHQGTLQTYWALQIPRGILKAECKEITNGKVKLLEDICNLRKIINQRSFKWSPYTHNYYSQNNFQRKSEMISQLKISVDEFKYGHCFFWSRWWVHKYKHYFKGQSKNIAEIHMHTNMNIHTQYIYLDINAHIHSHIYIQKNRGTHRKKSCNVVLLFW